MTTSEEPIKQSAWMAKSNIKFGKNNKSTVQIRKIVPLATDLVVKTLSRTFEVVSRDAHYISVASRIILADRVSGKIYQEEEVFKAEQIVNAQMAAINEYFDRRIAQAEQKIRMTGEDPANVQSRSQSYEAICTTRTATDFLQILQKADIYLVMNEYLWVAGELSDNASESIAAKLQNEKDVRQHLLSIPRKTTAQFQLLHRICKAVMEQRALDRASQSARDKARYAEQMTHEEDEAKVLREKEEAARLAKAEKQASRKSGVAKPAAVAVAQVEQDQISAMQELQPPTT